MKTFILVRYEGKDSLIDINNIFEIREMNTGCLLIFNEKKIIATKPDAISWLNIDNTFDEILEALGFMRKG